MMTTNYTSMLRGISFGALAAALVLATSGTFAKLPAPSDEAKAKAAETAAKTAHNGKIDAYLLCKAQDKVAAKFNKTKTKADTPSCADPGAFVYTPSAPAAVAVAPVAAPAPPPKK